MGLSLRMTDVRRPRRTSPAASVTAAAVLTTLAVVAVWAAAVLPDEARYLTPAAFVRVPVELVAILALGVLLPRRVRGPVAVLCGLLLAVALIVTVANIGFMLVFAREVDPVDDWAYVGPGVGVLRDTEGLPVAVAAAVGAAVAALALLVLLPLAARRRRPGQSPGCGPTRGSSARTSPTGRRSRRPSRTTRSRASSTATRSRPCAARTCSWCSSRATARSR